MLCFLTKENIVMDLPNKCVRKAYLKGISEHPQDNFFQKHL